MVMKKEYRKPEIRQVQLRPEEAVLTACKAAAPICKPTAGNNTCTTAAS